MRSRFNKKKAIQIFLGLIVFACFLMLIPGIRDRVTWRLDQLRIYLRYTLFPPEEAVFVPQEDSYVSPSLVPQKTETLVASSTKEKFIQTSTPTSQETPGVTETFTPTATQRPDKISLEGVKYEDQHGLWNYCAPANLAMALSYWGWEGDRLTTGKYLKPEEDDKNVMPYEMVDFVQTQTDLNAITRIGGTLDLLKNLLAEGFPVLIEKGMITQETLTGRMTWMGHYALLVGYDDEQQIFISRDSYFSPPDYPLDFPINYDEIISAWRGFNYVYIVIYPQDRENDVFEILGDYVDEETAARYALDRAVEESEQLTGIDLFFAEFNHGSCLVKLFDYYDAALVFDEAFTLYAALPKEDRPYRMMWYQTGPYFAYYYTNRYQDVIDLATTTISAADKPFLEESWYWRGLAKIAMGDKDGGVEDIRTSLKYHPDFEPSLQQLQNLGISQ